MLTKTGRFKYLFPRDSSLPPRHNALTPIVLQPSIDKLAYNSRRLTGGSMTTPFSFNVIKNSSDIELSDSQSTKITEAINFFQSEAEKKAPRTASAYRQAISIFNSFLNSIPEVPLEESLREFAVYLFLNGYTFKTASHYLDIITSLLNKWGKGKNADFQTAWQTVSPALWDGGISDAPFQRLLLLLKTAPRQNGETSVAIDFLLLALLHPHLSTEQISRLTVSDIPSLSPLSEDIVARQADPRRKFLFPLDHSYRTPRQLREHVDNLLRSLLKLRNIPLYGNIDQTIRSYRAYTALRAGLSPEDAAALAGGATPGVTVLSLFPTDNRGADEVSVSRMADVLLSNPLRWYALRLRPYVSYTELTERLSSLQKEKTLIAPELFYPHDEIARRVGKKIEFESKPVIRDVVFFKSRATDILPMLAKIGDLAWCYKNEGRRGSTYAAIPTTSFRHFQETIGKFTPDYEVAPIGTLPHIPGEKIEIIAGPFAGREARYIGLAKESTTSKIQNSDSGSNEEGPIPSSILFRCALIGDNGIEWRINLPAHFTN